MPKDGPLHKACKDGEYNQVIHLLQQPGVDVNAAGAQSRTPLHRAAAGGHVACVKALLNTGNADRTVRDRLGRSPLHWAALAGNDECVKLLLHEPVRPRRVSDSSVANGLSSSNVAAAASSSMSSILDENLNGDNANPNSISSGTATATMAAASSASAASSMSSTSSSLFLPSLSSTSVSSSSAMPSVATSSNTSILDPSNNSVPSDSPPKKKLSIAGRFMNMRLLDSKERERERGNNNFQNQNYQTQNVISLSGSLEANDTLGNTNPAHFNSNSSADPTSFTASASSSSSEHSSYPAFSSSLSFSHSTMPSSSTSSSSSVSTAFSSHRGSISAASTASTVASGGNAATNINPSFHSSLSSISSYSGTQPLPSSVSSSNSVVAGPQSLPTRHRLHSSSAASDHHVTSNHAASSGSNASFGVDAVVDDYLIPVSVRELMECKAYNGWTPLHAAASVNNRNIISTLLSLGADKNAVDNDGRTPWDVAIINGKKPPSKLRDDFKVRRFSWTSGISKFIQDVRKIPPAVNSSISFGRRHSSPANQAAIVAKASGSGSTGTMSPRNQNPSIVIEESNTTLHQATADLYPTTAAASAALAAIGRSSALPRVGNSSTQRLADFPHNIAKGVVFMHEEKSSPTRFEIFNMQALRNMESEKIMRNINGRMDRTLQVCILEAKELIENASAYCVVHCQHDRYRTPTVAKTDKPYWGENYSFSLHNDLNAPDQLFISVWSESSRPTKKSNFLGRVVLSRKDFPESGTQTEEWYPLKSLSMSVNEDVVAMGQLVLKMIWDKQGAESPEADRLSIQATEQSCLYVRPDDGADPYRNFVLEYVIQRYGCPDEKPIILDSARVEWNSVYTFTSLKESLPIGADTDLRVLIHVLPSKRSKLEQSVGSVLISLSGALQHPNMVVCAMYEIGPSVNSLGLSLGATQGTSTPQPGEESVMMIPKELTAKDTAKEIKDAMKEMKETIREKFKEYTAPLSRQLSEVASSLSTAQTASATSSPPPLPSSALPVPSDLTSSSSNAAASTAPGVAPPSLASRFSAEITRQDSTGDASISNNSASSIFSSRATMSMGLHKLNLKWAQSRSNSNFSIVSGGGDDDFGTAPAKGYLRLRIRYTEERVLPVHLYDDFVQILTQDENYMVIRGLTRLKEYKEELMSSLIKFYGKHGLLLSFMSTILGWEIQSTESINVLFRGNSLASKATDVYMKFVGKQYLRAVLQEHIDLIFSEKRNCEINPVALGKGQDLEANLRNLTTYVQSILTSIIGSEALIPRSLRYVFNEIRKRMAVAFGDAVMQQRPGKAENLAPYTSISAFIFLRFFCPAIMSPKLFGLREEYADPKVSRTLTLIAKTVQCAANFVIFGEKEPYMTPMNDILIQYTESLQFYLDAICKIPEDDDLDGNLSNDFLFDEEESHIFNSFPLDKELAYLGRYLQTLRPKLLDTSKTETKDKTTMKIVEVFRILDALEPEYAALNRILSAESSPPSGASRLSGSGAGLSRKMRSLSNGSTQSESGVYGRTSFDGGDDFEETRMLSMNADGTVPEFSPDSAASVDSSKSLGIPRFLLSNSQHHQQQQSTYDPKQEYIGEEDEEHLNQQEIIRYDLVQGVSARQ